MSAQLQTAQTTYFHRLDAIRGLAILWVVLYHFFGAACGWKTHEWEQAYADAPWWLSIPSAILGRLLAMGGMGVPIFFVLSGFLIHYTYSRSSDQRVTMFWFRRWGRIYPAYFVALLAFTLWQGALLSARGRTNFWTHLFLIHSFHDRTIFGINGSFWSLAHEAHFYLLYPLLLQVRHKVGMLPLLLGSLVMRLAISGWFLVDPGHFATVPATTTMLPRMYFEWILGMYVADCFIHGKRALPWGRAAGGLCMVYAFLAFRTAWWDLGVVPAVAAAAAIWIDQIVHKRGDASRLERALIPLGVISYSVYLWHQPIVKHLSQQIIRSSPATETIGIAGAIAVALILSCLASIIVGAGAYHLFEAPSMEWVKRCAKRFQPVPPPAASSRGELPPKEVRLAA